MSTSLTQFDEHGRRTLEADLERLWSQVLDVPEVGVHDDFFQRGGDPERGARMLRAVKEKYEVAIPTEELYEARTIGKLADLIQMKLSSQEKQCVVPIRATGNRPPLFLVHGVGGNILGFAGLARVLDADQPVYGIQAQALQNGAPTLIKLESMAEFYVKELRQVQPSGPYAFLGFSFGGLVAYEMAQQLGACGEHVHFLGMLDTWQPGFLKQVQSAQPRWKRAWERLNRIRLNTRKLSLFQLAPYAYVRLKARFLRVAYGQMANAVAVSLPDSMKRVREINLMAAARYEVRPYTGNITMFRAKDDAPNLPDDLAWRKYARGGVEVCHLPGDHGQILAEPNLSYMAATVTACLARGSADSQATALREEFEVDTESVVRLDPYHEAGVTWLGTPRKVLK